MAKYKAMDIAKWFILRNNIEEEKNYAEKISLLKLLKLLYYAEGCSLALGNGDLFDEKIVAWEHGPVVTEVYNSFTDAYNLKINETSMSQLGIDKHDANVLEQVFNIFGAYTAWGLRNKTHEETPWKITTQNGTILNKEIPKDIIQKYFEENYVTGD